MRLTIIYKNDYAIVAQAGLYITIFNYNRRTFTVQDIIKYYKLTLFLLSLRYIRVTPTTKEDSVNALNLAISGFFL